MKLAFLLFGLGLVCFVSTDYLNQVIPHTNLHAQLENSAGAQAFLANLDDVLDATNSPVIKRTLSFGFCDRVDVHPGFLIIHDPGLGREVVVTAPEAVFEHLNLGDNSNGRLEPDFDRPVRLNELVEVRVNLHAHGSKRMRIGMYDCGLYRTKLEPNFVTAGKLNFTFLKFFDIPTHRIDIDSKNVVIHTDDDTFWLYGKTDRLEFLFNASKDGEKALDLSAPNLAAGKVLRTKLRK